MLPIFIYTILTDFALFVSHTTVVKQTPMSLRRRSTVDKARDVNEEIEEVKELDNASSKLRQRAVGASSASLGRAISPARGGSNRTIDSTKASKLVIDVDRVPDADKTSIASPSASPTSPASQSPSVTNTSTPVVGAHSPISRPGTNAVLNTNMGRKVVAKDKDGVRLLYLTSKILSLSSVSNVDQCFTVRCISVYLHICYFPACFALTNISTGHRHRTQSIIHASFHAVPLSFLLTFCYRLT